MSPGSSLWSPLATVGRMSAPPFELLAFWMSSSPFFGLKALSLIFARIPLLARLLGLGQDMEVSECLPQAETDFLHGSFLKNRFYAGRCFFISGKGNTEGSFVPLGPPHAM